MKPEMLAFGSAMAIIFAFSSAVNTQTVEWTRQLGPGSSGFGTAAAADAAGMFGAGYVGGALPGQAFAGGSSDAFLLKVASDVSTFSTVSAANFAPSAPLAPALIAAGFGTNLVPTSEVAPAMGPLPTVLEETSVFVTDSAGTRRAAPLWFVSPGQFDYYLSEQTALGLATVSVVRNSQTVASGTLQIETVSPGLFTMNNNGQGVPAALAIFAKPDGSQTWQYVFNSGCVAGSCQPVPIDLGPATDQVFLQLYGTGIRGRSSLAGVSATIGGVSAPVEYAGAVAGMVGLDQVNLRVPRGLAGRGQVDVVLTVDGKTANTVQINIVTAGGSPYPLKVSSNGRYTVTQQGAPFLIRADSPHAVIGRLSLTDAETYFAGRQAMGINAIWAEMFCSTYSSICPAYTTYDGIAPFTVTNDISTPNEAYFARVDAMLALAAKYGITMFLDPTETGGWMDILRSNGSTKCYNFGAYLGNRYKNVPNIVWLHGNDFQTWTTTGDNNDILAVANGIASQDSNHLQTLELEFPVSSSLDNAAWASRINLEAAYSYYPPYDQVIRDYSRESFLPVFYIEGVYEFQDYEGGYHGPHELRAQAFWSILSGATGTFYGNANLYPFPTGWASTNWNTTPGITQFKILNDFVASKAWWTLVPDSTHAVVTAGYGTYGRFNADGSGVTWDLGMTSDYATTARSSDGSLVLCYMPTSRQVTVDMTKLSGKATALWFDPVSGAYTAISGSPFANTGTHNFTPPGNNSGGDSDWVLVLEAQ